MKVPCLVKLGAQEVLNIFLNLGNQTGRVLKHTKWLLAMAINVHGSRILPKFREEFWRISVLQITSKYILILPDQMNPAFNGSIFIRFIENIKFHLGGIVVNTGGKLGSICIPAVPVDINIKQVS